MVKKLSRTGDLAMSSSTKSKPASDASPATGSAVDPDDAKDETADDATEATNEATNEATSEAAPEASSEAAPEATSEAVEAKAGKTKSKRVVVTFEVSRNRDAWWTVFGILFGSLLIWKLGTVGVWAGVMFVVYGVFRGYELVQSFLHSPGLIEVTDSQVTLPRGVWMSKPIVVPPSAVTSVYFLRRSVPWNNSAPVLIVELGSHALAYPRDWFASEADQRHIVHALLRNSSAKTGAVPPETSPKHDEGNAIMWAQLLGGVALLAGGVIAWMMAPTPISNTKYILFIAPIFTGWLFAWRGLMRW